MLKPEELGDIGDYAEELFAQLQYEMMAKVAKSLKNSESISSHAAWQLDRLQESGKLHQDLVKEVSSFWNKSEMRVHDLFRDAGVKAVSYDNQIYKEAFMTGMLPEDVRDSIMNLGLSPALAQIMNASAVKNIAQLKNMTMQTAKNATELHTRMLDEAYLAVASGGISYNEAIKNAVDKMTTDGLKAATFASGRSISIEAFARRAILTGINQTAGEMQLARSKELGSDLVETTAHSGARPEHEYWQGQVFSISGDSDKYDSFYAVTDYGSVTGLCGANCRHNFYPFFEGLSEVANTREQLKSFEDEKVTYTDFRGKQKTVSKYEATQRLRHIEKNIRKCKYNIKVLEGMDMKGPYAEKQLSKWQKRARDFTTETGLRRRYANERIGRKLQSPISPKVPSTTTVAHERLPLAQRIEAVKKNFKGKTSPGNLAYVQAVGKEVLDEVKKKNGGAQVRFDVARRKFDDFLKVNNYDELYKTHKKKEIEIKSVIRQMAPPSDYGYKTLEAMQADFEKLDTKFQELRKEMLSLRKEIEDATQEMNSKMSGGKGIFGKMEALKATIGEIREVGISGMEDSVKTHLKSSRSPMRKVVTDAYDVYPTDWTMKSMRRGPLSPGTSDRGYYWDGHNGDGAEIRISGGTAKSNMQTAIHEVGHRFEYSVAGILEDEKAFYIKRTKGEDLQWMGPGYNRSEVTRVDKFLDTYMGKEYNGRAYELVSMGFEMAFTRPDELWKDEDFATFIYGILATR